MISPREDRNGPHRRAGSTAYLQRQANKPKTSPANEPVQVDQVLIMRKAQFPTNMMHFPIRNVAHTRRPVSTPKAAICC